MDSNIDSTKLIDSGEVYISHPPHIWSGFSTNRLMYVVAATIALPSAAAVYFFGLRALYLILISVATAVLTEFAIKKLRKKPFFMDGSAVITGMLFALVLPPRIPFWMAIIGAAFSIAIAKEAFGGLGYNIFNPALAGRAFLAICFSNEMTSWYLPSKWYAAGFAASDALTSASPLSDNYIYEGTRAALYKDLFFGNIAGSIGETSALAILIGGLILIGLRLIDWKIPVIYIGTVALGSLIFGKDILFQVLAGGLMIGAFFMATDYVTSPVTGPGRMIFAFGAGIITLLIRNFGAMPEGVAFSILIMNSFTPLIDKYVRPKPFG
ncbi:MAG: RnfABCDGE type electron transport complex subunit D, partial [Actinobacteria bacterium]|nr:RnfABCDGE type electron transport complex subunit D [Actinomycetota bacterium]